MRGMHADVAGGLQHLVPPPHCTHHARISALLICVLSDVQSCTSTPRWSPHSHARMPGEPQRMHVQSRGVVSLPAAPGGMLCWAPTNAFRQGRHVGSWNRSTTWNRALRARAGVVQGTSPGSPGSGDPPAGSCHHCGSHPECHMKAGHNGGTKLVANQGTARCCRGACTCLLTPRCSSLYMLAIGAVVGMHCASWPALLARLVVTQRRASWVVRLHCSAVGPRHRL